MKTYFLNNGKNKNLIVFFAGWSFDFNPFKKLNCENFDVLFVYDYNSLDLPEKFEIFDNYDKKFLIGWSMGVFIAYKLKALFKDFDYKLAINGTITPVNDQFGIPTKIFELTLKHAQKGLEGKFYQNIFLTEQEYNTYKQFPVERTIENRVCELENLYTLSKNSSGEKFYDFAIVSESDKIIPPNNQIASHKLNDTPFITLPYGHFPFYKFNSWDEIIECKQTINQ